MSDQSADPVRPVPPSADQNPALLDKPAPPRLPDPAPPVGEDPALQDEPIAAPPLDEPPVWASGQTGTPAPQDAPTVATSPALPPPPAGQPSVWAGGQPVAYPDSPPEPQVGDRYPAAVLPGAPQPTAVLPGPEFPPSGPIPMAPRTGPIPVPQPPPVPYMPRKPRDKAVVWLTTAVVFFVLAAGALGAMWLVEVGDHKGTTSELQSVRDNLDKTKADLKTAQADKDSATAAKQRLERDVENNKPCLTAVKAMVRAVSEEEFKKFADEVDINC